jgi:hypothetical protein
MKNDQPLLLPNSVYHICTHAINNNNFFKENENYGFFLKKYQKYIPPIADTYSYCLLPNHFHLAVKFKKAEFLLAHFNKSTGNDHDTGEDSHEVPNKAHILEADLPSLLSQQFSNLFNAYTKSFNKKYNRRGTLFERNFNRYLITDRLYFKTVILYILANPVHHGFTDDFKDWAFSAYWEMFYEATPILINRDTVFNVFTHKDQFKTELEKYAKGKIKDWYE